MAFWAVDVGNRDGVKGLIGMRLGANAEAEPSVKNTIRENLVKAMVVTFEEIQKNLM